jgi:hypothetical protein
MTAATSERFCKMREWVSALFLASLAALAPIHPMLVSVGVIVFADLITGIWAAKKRGESVQSAKLRNTVTKFLIYNVAVITGFVFEKYLIAGAVPAAQIIAGAIGLAEVKSVLENASVISGQDLFKMLIGSTNLKK